MKRVLACPSDGGGCGSYRIIWPGMACMAAGKTVTVATRSPEILVDDHGNVQGINVGRSEVVVLQRPGSLQIQQAIRVLQDNGVKVIIDMDDSLSKIHPRNPVYKEYDPRINQQRNWMNAAKACDMADWVTVTSEALAEEYGSHGRVTIIPNYIPSKFLRIPRPQNEKPIITWAGWTLTHPDDLSVTSGMINQVLVETGSVFMAYGDAGIFQNLGIRMREPHLHEGFTGIQDYPKTLSKADIGLVPLKASPFNEAKSYLKALEYAALGIVPVVTPTPQNQKMVDMGAAIPAASAKEWYNEVKKLVEDNEYRQEMSDQVRKIASGLTIEDNYNLWWDAWSNV